MFNRAPFSYQEFSFNKNINVLSGINGSGKTTILSHVADMLFELAKLGYPKSFEANYNNFYRIESVYFSKDMSKSSYVYVRFNVDGKDYDYIDCCSFHLSEDDYSKISLDNLIDIKLINEKLSHNNGIVKYFSLIGENDKFDIYSTKSTKISASIFSSNVLTYFPAYRFDFPNYLNEIYKSRDTEFPVTLSSYSGFLPNPIEVRSDFSVLFDWIIDVILDSCMHERLQQEWQDDRSRQNKSVDPFKNTALQLNLIINKILKSKYSCKNEEKFYKFQCGPRNLDKGRLVISDSDNEIVLPSIYNLSSGELSVFSIFCEVFRQADKLHQNISCKDICGMVVIDEIEKHLHIKLQYDVLPDLIALFPNVQFVVSSHSPFFHLGLHENEQTRLISEIFDLSNKGYSIQPQNTDLFKEVYNIMLAENDKYLDKYLDIKSEIDKLNRPLVLTEGKTDRKLINKAKEVLKISDVEFEFVSDDNCPSGDEDLFNYLKNLSKVPNRNKIIGVFDHDNPKIFNQIDNDELPYKAFGNNVYAFCIPIPKTRSLNNENFISIEMLFSDDEIMAELEEHKRLFLTTEFNEFSRHITQTQLSLKNPIKNKLLEFPRYKI